MAKGKKETPNKELTSNEIENATLDLVKKSIAKKYGSVVTTLADDDTNESIIVPTISTGCLHLDAALGRGGMAFGRIYEIFGPHMSGKSTLADSVVIQAQRRGLKCIYVDAEYSKDPELFVNYGGKASELEIVRGMDGEENLDILENLLKTGIYKVAVVDSVAALVPREEMEKGFDEKQMGAHARLMSKALRKMNPMICANGILFILINQIRLKVNSYGCFHYDTLVNFSDGRSLPIGEVVEKKIEGDVWCINEVNGNIESKPIVGWHDNGEVYENSDFLHIQTSSIGGAGRFGFTCTPIHELYTGNGWKKAEDFSVGDKLVSKYEQTINGTYGDFLSGILVGDSHISIRDKNTGSLRLQDNENEEYLSWKIKKLSDIIEFKKIELDSSKIRYNSKYTYELAKIKQNVGDRDPMYLLNNFSDLGFAIWMMDDGNLDLTNGHRRYGLSVKRFKNDVEKLEAIKNKFNSLGFICSYNLKTGFFCFETSETDSIASIICKYVPKCMEYKLPEEYRNRYEEFDLSNNPIIVKDYVEIKEIRKASDRQMRKRRKFDISVEDNHNYMVGGKYNGVIVHNSPETTTGGGALGYYASGRIAVQGPEAKDRRIKGDDGEVIGHTSIFTVIKNKLSAPFRTAETNLIYGKGYDVYWEVLKLATSVGVIDRAGAWYKYQGENIAQGEMNAALYLKDPANSDIFNKILTQVIEQSGLKEKYEHSLNPGPLYS